MTALVVGVLLGGIAIGAALGVALHRTRLNRWASAHEGTDDARPGAESPEAGGVTDRGGRSLSARDVTARGGRSLSAREVIETAQASRIRAETERSAAEFAAWRLVASLDALRTGLVVCDRDGAVVARNTAAAVLLTARHGEALVTRAINRLLEQALEGERASAEVELHAEPRRTYDVEARPIERDGEIIGAVVVVRDITEQLRIEAIRRDFVANVSHELKTPIGAVSLLADSLVAGEQEPEVVAQLSDRIQLEIQRVSNTIDDLLTLSSLEEGDSPLEELADVDEAVRASLDRISETAEQRGVEVAASGSAATPVRGSRIQLESALFNLLDNAVKFSEPGGRVDVQVVRDNGVLTIVVSDQGVGIPIAEQSRIFERFYRVDRARSRHTGGTGLGLSIVRHVVLNHGGEVSVASREGYGAAFTITLPLAAED